MKLSVSIPSNNKKQYLIQTLSYFLKLKNEINFEICISDNSDNSNKYFDQFISKNSKEIIYKKNKLKKMSENFDNAVKISSGEYVWIFGDDDLPTTDSIHYILNIINNDKLDPDIIIVNSKSFHKNLKIIENKRLNFDNDIFFDEKEDDKFLETLISYTTFISSIIIKRKSWIKTHIQKEDDFFFHIQKLLEIKKNKQAYFISKPLLYMRVFSQTWTASYFKIWMIIWPQIIWNTDGYCFSSKKKVIHRNPLNSIKLVLAKRAYGYFTFDNYKKFIIGNSSVSIFSKIINLIIVMTPRFFLRNVYILLIYLKIKKRSISFSPELSLVQLKK